ncbi:hypothetical protein DY000_02025671 [Brassica cretica]|uniref:Knottin scorpion toxin-like domain-containing protein n=1 Tax=Brassica cretica TaxID=69181 RepID=A0ABQ7E2I4_BRACR|nr:hypothetical protein DY000_02025671 [Brassica cretica]
MKQQDRSCHDQKKDQRYSIPKCPGVCSPGIVPDCKTLCTGLGFHAGYCKGLTCCCKPKFSNPSRSEARAEIYDPKCPGVCSPVAVPDCKTLCANLGFPGSYCKGLTCCCKPKSSKPPLS